MWPVFLSIKRFTHYLFLKIHCQRMHVFFRQTKVHVSTRCYNGWGGYAHLIIFQPSNHFLSCNYIHQLFTNKDRNEYPVYFSIFVVKTQFLIDIIISVDSIVIPVISCVILVKTVISVNTVISVFLVNSGLWNKISSRVNSG